MPGPTGPAGSGSGLSSTVPFNLNDTNENLLLSITKTGTGTTRIETPQDDLSLRSARDITLYAGSDGPGEVYIGWGDAVYTPDSPNRVATVGYVDDATGASSVKYRTWGYPTEGAIAIMPTTDNEGIALKSSDSAAIRWHVRNNGASAAGAGQLIPTSAEVVAGDGNYLVTFTFPAENSVPTITQNYYSVTAPNSTNYNGVFLPSAATTTTLTLIYESDPGAFDPTDSYINQPSVYSQVEANEDGVWIKNANWSSGPGSYSNYWQFTKDGSIHFPYGPSNNRTGYGDVLRFATSFDQSIITGTPATFANPTANRLVIAGQDGAAGDGYDGEGGDIYLWAGRGGGANGDGGDIKIDGGNGQGTGFGGYVKIRGGYTDNGEGGFVNIDAGNSSNGAGGSVTINAGDNYNDTESYGGSISLNAGSSGNAMGGGSIVLSTSQAGKITLNGDGGEYLNSVEPGNQIATVSDISTAVGVGGNGEVVRYTPTFEATGLEFTGTAETHPTYNSHYVKNGRMVTFFIEIDMATVTNFGTGQYKTALPFAPLAGTMNHFASWCLVDETANPDNAGHAILQADHLANTSVLDLHYIKQSGGANSPVMEAMFKQGSPVTLTTATHVYINGTYITAA